MNHKVSQVLLACEQALGRIGEGEGKEEGLYASLGFCFTALFLTLQQLWQKFYTKVRVN